MKSVGEVPLSRVGRVSSKGLPRIGGHVRPGPDTRELGDTHGDQEMALGGIRDRARPNDRLTESNGHEAQRMVVQGRPRSSRTPGFHTRDASHGVWTIACLTS